MLVRLASQCLGFRQRSPLFTYHSIQLLIRVDVLSGELFQNRIGRSNTLYIIFTVIALALAVLAFVPGQAGFAVGIIGLGICFGGVMGVFPSIVMENYGPANQGVNYGIVFTGYSVAAYFAPSIASNIAVANNGSFSIAFYIAIILALAGPLLNFLYGKISQKA